MRISIAVGLTFCSQIVCTGHLIHRLQGFLLLAQKGLLVIVLAGAAEAVEQDAAGAGAARGPKDKDDEADEENRAKRRDEADDDARQGRRGI